jgi:lysophospholipase L1-like esterase
MSVRISLAALIGALLFAMMEVSLRALTSYDSKWNVRLGAHRVLDPVTRFRNAPRHRFAEGVVTNERGYLAPVGLRAEKPSDKLRLVYVGDSVTFLPPASNYPTHLAELLRERTGHDVETVNTAVPGFSSENARALFETEVSQLFADVLFIYLGWNDLGQYGPEGLPYKRMEAGYSISPLERLLVYSYSARLPYALRQLLSRLEPAVDEPLSESEVRLYASYRPRHFEENLRAIIAAARPRVDHIALLNLATITNPNPTAEELRKAHFPVGMGKNMRKLDLLVRIYNDALAQVAREERVMLVDLHAAFDDPSARADLTDSCHVTPAGALRIARTLLTSLPLEHLGRGAGNATHAVRIDTRDLAHGALPR